MGATNTPLKKVLFLCTGNSARSQMAEALLRHVAGGRFQVFSAGTTPRDSVHPEPIQMLQHQSVPIDGLTPKDVATFAGQQFEYVITLCDKARSAATGDGAPLCGSGVGLSDSRTDSIVLLFGGHRVPPSMKTGFSAEGRSDRAFARRNPGG